MELEELFHINYITFFHKFQIYVSQWQLECEFSSLWEGGKWVGGICVSLWVSYASGKCSPPASEPHLSLPIIKLQLHTLGKVYNPDPDS